MIAAAVLAVATIALALAIAALILWMRTDRRAQAAQARLAEVLERELAHQRTRSLQLERILDYDMARRHGYLEPQERDLQLERAAAVPAPFTPGAVAVGTPATSPLPEVLRRELHAIDGAEEREELELEVRRLLADGIAPEEVVRHLFEGH